MAAKWIMTWIVAGVWSLMALPATAQETAGEWAWRPLFEHAGVAFTYLFYSRADNRNDGVVLKLTNTNDYAVDYRFKVVFRADGAEVVEAAQGALDAHESKTGDADGLFWIPFRDGRSIGEVGLRGFEIAPKAEREEERGSSPPGALFLRWDVYECLPRAVSFEREGPEFATFDLVAHSASARTRIHGDDRVLSHCLNDFSLSWERRPSSRFPTEISSSKSGQWMP